jgi:hypothetical protein
LTKNKNGQMAITPSFSTPAMLYGTLENMMLKK